MAFLILVFSALIYASTPNAPDMQTMPLRSRSPTYWRTCVDASV